jgi:GR25 family glycosyltransferase involved in LPS biosynthesis
MESSVDLLTQLTSYVSRNNQDMTVWNDKMKAIIISREQDRERRRRIQENIPGSVNWTFLSASDGHRPEAMDERYAKLISGTFWGQGKIKPGAFGCFVSHYRAWLECLHANTPVLILEDDVCFCPQHALGIEALKYTHWDVILLNRAAVGWNLLNQEYKGTRLIPIAALRRKMALRASRVMTQENRGDLTKVRSLREIVMRLAESSVIPDSPDAPGAYGYALMPDGARKLVALAENLGVVVGVDWFMLGSAITGENLTGRWSIPGKVAKYFQNADIVNIGVSDAWIVESIDGDVGGSVINHTQLVAIEEYAKRIGTERRGLANKSEMNS